MNGDIPLKLITVNY